MSTKGKDRNDIKLIVVQFGLAIAVSFASFLYSSRRRIRIPPPKTPDCGDQIQSNQSSPTVYGLASVPSERFEEANPQRRASGLNEDEEAFCSPEIDDPVNKLDTSGAAIDKFPLKSVDLSASDINPEPCTKHEEEIAFLQETVRAFRAREQSLEDQLLELYGLREQQATVMELQNRLKLNFMEAKLFSIKIETLKAENRRLGEQVQDRAGLAAELEAAKVKIQLLKKKLGLEAEHNREQIEKLKQRVAKFQDENYKSFSSCTEVQAKLKRVAELEGEINDLRRENSMLQLENSEMARNLESARILANSVLEDSETETLREACERLRHENENLRMETEQLKAGRCSDIEELVYLRWINACLRHELRNYHPAEGKSVVARDLSKTLSPRSEEKAKQLILEYANSEGISENSINFVDLFDSDRWSDSHTSFTDSTDSPNTSGSSRKSLVKKLKKLVSGKEVHQNDKSESVENGDLPRYRHSLDVLRSSRSTKEGSVSDMEVGVGDRSELLKYADALKKSRRGSVKLHRKSASYSSF